MVVAAGNSTRMNGVDKVFTPILGVPLVAYCLDQLESFPYVSEIVLVLSSPSLDRGRDLLSNRGYQKVAHVCTGGERRQDSVRCGLEKLTNCRWVIIHDGARPCLDHGILRRGLAAVEECGAAVAGVPVKDTIKLVSPQGRITDTPDRDRLWAAQTPQLFDYALLWDAHLRCTQQVTDDATMVENLGHPVQMFLGSYENLKVTTPEDLTVAESFLRSQRTSFLNTLTQSRGASSRMADTFPADFRVGIGFDSHPLTPGRSLVLGGVTIPYHLGLAGHSDGDVLVHAMMDALLGAAGLGDKGVHFPSGDPQYKDISSLLLLAKVADLLAANRWRIGNVDATMLAQKPRLDSFIASMREQSGAALSIPLERVSIKATTTDYLGFVGREEGIAACAVASLVAGP